MSVGDKGTRVLGVGTRRETHFGPGQRRKQFKEANTDFGQGQRRKQINEATLTSVKTSVATGSTQNS